ncbi:MAG: phosphate ABC transporter permease subunit PstC, partial [Acidobacteriaceae bacterium]
MSLRIQEPRAPQPPGASGAVGVTASRTAAAPTPDSAVRTFLQNRGNSRWADTTFRWLMLLCALSIFAIVALIFTELLTQSQLTLHKFGWRFFVGSAWNPVSGEFGALPFIYGTIVSSLVALIIAVPLAVGVAVFLTEMCPKALRGPFSFMTELLAAIPSVVYGLWGIFILVPLLRTYIDPLLIGLLGWTGLFTRPDFGVGLFAAGVILAIMILPIVSSLTREVMSAVPHTQREAVLALGATRWEMIRMG